MRILAGALLFFLLAACGSPPAPSAPSGPPPVEHIALVDRPVDDDDGRLHFFRNYFALEQVGREAHHFTAWYLDVEPSHCEATVLGGDVKLTGCMWGGMSVPPSPIPPVPADLATEHALVESAVQGKSPNATHVRVGYSGSYRELVLSEMIVVTGAQMMGNRVGWHGRVHLKANPALTKIEGMAPGRSQSAYGMIQIPSDAARVDFRVPSDDNPHLLTHGLMLANGALPEVGHGRALIERVLAVARDVAAGKPVPSFGALLASPVDPSLPASYDQPVALNVTIYARHANFQKQEHRELVLRLHPREAAEKGKALASAETDIDGIHVKVTATMSRFAPTTQNPKTPLQYEGRDMEANLDVHVEDSRGNVFDRAYPARGKVVGDAPALATPGGLVLPGTSSPSAAADALRFTWPGQGAATQFDVYINPTLFAAP